MARRAGIELATTQRQPTLMRLRRMSPDQWCRFQTANSSSVSLEQKPPATPKTTPSNTSFNPLPMVSFKTSRFCAPSHPDSKFARRFSLKVLLRLNVSWVAWAFANTLTDARRAGNRLYIAVCGRRDVSLPRSLQKRSQKRRRDAPHDYFATLVNVNPP